MEDVIKLIQENITVDEYGNETVAASAPKEVFALIASVGRNEFYAAAHAGLKPEITFRSAWPTTAAKNWLSMMA